MAELEPLGTGNGGVPKNPAGWKVNVLLAVATVACLLPFVGKAVHMDDPLFLWTARQIRKSPFDFYGFNVNWYGSPEPMSGVMKNPPLHAYLLAAANEMVDGDERGLHALFLVAAVAAILGTHAIAREMCANPLVASFATLLTPAFLISSTNLMCDTTLVAFWVWSIYFWLTGIRQVRWTRLFIAAVLIAAAGLTKYFGAALVPLLAAYTVMKDPKRPWLLIPMLVPVGAFVGYDLWTRQLYGKGLFFDAAEYATGGKSPGVEMLFSRTTVGLSYAGGCLASIPFMAWILWQKRTLFLACAAILAGTILLLALGGIGRWEVSETSGTAVLLSLQVALFAAGGVSILALAATDLRKWNADGLLLFLWVFGVFVFATYVNWTTNGRSVLPMAPAAGILAARRLEQRAANRSGASHPSPGQQAFVPLLASAVLALSVTFEDFQFANANRLAAMHLTQKLREPNQRLPYQGHWGFQYYMGRRGGRHIDLCNDKIDVGKVFVMPERSTNGIYPEGKDADLREILDVPKLPFLSTYSPANGTSFYSSSSGPLPFAVCQDPTVRFFVFQCTVDLFFQVKNTRIRTES